MSSIQFTDRVRDYLRTVGSTQYELAQALGLHPGVLGRKLRGSGNAHLTHQEIKRIIIILAGWCAISTWSEVISLLELAHMNSRNMSEEEWHTPPLSELERDVSLHLVSDTAPPAFPIPMPLLPPLATQLVGRQEEMQRLPQLLTGDDVRLLTLVGPGGSGKTRLAMEAATCLRPVFAHQVYWVALAGMRDPDLLPAHILQALGLKSLPGISSLHILIRYLHDHRLLLVLDNFEHVNRAAYVVSELLDTTTALLKLINREI